MTVDLSAPIRSGGVASPSRPGTGRGADLYLAFLGVVLSGYALDGRGFAYLGVPPLFIGEVAMLLGLVVLWRSRGWIPLLRMPPAMALLPLSAWGMVRTGPYVSEYGANALRDAAVWGYSAFSWIIAGILIAKPSRLTWLVRGYRRLARTLVLGLPLVALVYRSMWTSLPRWPGTVVPMIFLKEGDALVHFSGVLAFWVSGFGGRVGWPWLSALAASVAVLGMVDRAGLISFMAVMALCVTLWPRSTVPWRIIAMTCVAVLVLWVTDLRIDVPEGKNRQISFDQILRNVSSMVGDSDNEGLDGTKTWRLNWWTDIVDYTFNGRHFWTGKGFGVNLADDDGFQVLADGSLRTPHNVHLNFLARAGVPGLALWALAQGAWGCAILRAFLKSRRARDRDWLGLFLFLGCFWTACMINASFDVFLEGPVGGVWFWSIYGVGLAALSIHHRCPEAIRAAAPPADPPSQI